MPTDEHEKHSHPHTAQSSHPHQDTAHTPHKEKVTDTDTHDVKTLLEWTAPGRPHSVRSREFYINAFLIVLALEVILFFFKEYMLMMVILSVGFLVYALSSTPPAPLRTRISTEGIAVEDHFYLWQELYDFYFKDRHGKPVLFIRTKAYLPGELVLLLGDVDKETMKQTLLPYLPYREVVHSTFTERAGEWVVRSFPLEKQEHHSPQKPS